MGCYCQLFYCRVVGQWDVFGQYLKCYSVRPVRGREEGLARSWVEASDRSMRQMVATIPEVWLQVHDIVPSWYLILSSHGNQYHYKLLEHVEVEKVHWLQIVTGFDGQLKEPVLAAKWIKKQKTPTQYCMVYHPNWPCCSPARRSWTHTKSENK